MKQVNLEAQERRLAQALREELGGEAAPDLVAAVRARAQAHDWPADMVVRPSRWRAAALIVAGVAVAVSTAWWAHTRDSAVQPAGAAQDPAPTQEPQWQTVTTIAELAALDDRCRALRLLFWNNDPDRGGGIPAATGLASALHRASKVERLDLTVGDDTNLLLTEPDLQRLGQQTSLRELRCAGRSEIQPAWLAALSGLPVLTTLSLPHVPVGDVGAEHLAKIPNLQDLELAFDGTLTDAGLQAIVGIAGLRSLSVRGCGALTASGLAALGKCRQLERLDLRLICGKVTGAPRKLPARFLSRIETMIESEMVAAGGPGGVDDALLKVLAGLPSLRDLDVAGCPSITHEGLQAIGKLPLRSFAVSIRAGDAAEQLGSLSPTIESLSLAYSKQVDDAALAALVRQVPHLRALDLQQCGLVTDVGLAALLERTTLERLDLRGCKGLTAAVLPALLAAKSLRVLDVSGHRWVDADAERELRAMPAMQDLRNEKGGFMAAKPK